MNFLLPPTGASLRQNLKLLAVEWQGAGLMTRYFMASQLLSAGLLGLCSLASMAAVFAGLTVTYLGMLAAAGLCFVHTFATWHVLKTRCRVRYEVW
jgi:hypothetical protein